MGYFKAAFWVACAATAGLYAVIHFWSYPQIISAANGLAPFDLRLSGYSFEDARQFLAALPPEQTGFYSGIQSGLLDNIFTALFAFTLFSAIVLLAHRLLDGWAWALGLVAAPGAIVGYLENINVRLMLVLGPDGITPGIAAKASARTVAKAMFTTAAMSVLLVLAALWIWNRMTAQHSPGRGGLR